jgi:hypothetical protein
VSLNQRQLTPREAFERQYVKVVLKLKRPIVELETIFRETSYEKEREIYEKIQEFRSSRELKEWLLGVNALHDYVALPELVRKIKGHRLEKAVVWMIEREIGLDILNKLIADVTAVKETANSYLEQILSLAKKYFGVVEVRSMSEDGLTGVITYFIYDEYRYLGSIEKRVEECNESPSFNIFHNYSGEPVCWCICTYWSLK